MIEARFYLTRQNNKVICKLCPHECIISDGKSGVCKVRGNIGGKLYSFVYAKPVTTNFDPIEKKPLYHFYPGTKILSIGTLGCNMKCFFCQNSEISQIKSLSDNLPVISPGEIILMAGSRKNNTGIAYTYNEPIVFYEYMLDIARLARESNYKNVMVSNGFINPQALCELLEVIDAFNIDLKSFDDNFYREHTHSRLNPVLETIKSVKKSGKHLEITNLVIPGLNDNKDTFKEMIKWINNECGSDTVFHLSRYFPRYKCDLPPTPENTLNELFQIASEHLHFVYAGNYETHSGNNTVCPVCHSLLIERQGYYTSLTGLDNKGYCRTCNEKIISHI